AALDLPRSLWGSCALWEKVRTGAAPLRSTPAVAAEQCSGDLLKGAVGDRDHFLVGAVLNRMLDEDRGGITAEGARLRGGAVDELDGGDEHSGDAARLEVDDVVHTARRARPSVGERFDDGAAVLGDVVA